MMNNEKRFSYLKDYKVKFDMPLFYERIKNDSRLYISTLKVEGDALFGVKFALGSEEGVFLFKLSENGGTQHELVHALTAFALRFGLSGTDPLMWAVEAFDECAGFSLTEAADDGH